VGKDPGYDVTAREDVLARLRAAIGAETATAAAPREYRTSGVHGPGSEHLLSVFTERLEDYRASVRTSTARGLAASVARAVTERGAQRIAVVPGLHLKLAKVLGAFEVASDDPPLGIQALERLDGVVTGCALAIAETGTIVLDGSPLSGRRALTLVPDYHLVVVRAEQIVESVPEAVARLDPRAPLTWVSGPSATSDIELSRVEGVHGPRTLEVVLVS
jgi:L-lactate dehydrogenase complex protein LldG